MLVVERFASLVSAYRACLVDRPEIALQHAAVIRKLCRERMPHGSGFDVGVQLVFEKSTESKLVFETAFHHMNENGYYDGWTEHTVTVTPSFLGRFDLKVSGSDRNGIKDCIHEIFMLALSAEPNIPREVEPESRG